MRVLVTGAAGFIGSHLVDRLITAGHDVCGVDNYLTGRYEHECITKLDVASPAFNAEVPSNTDVILHCAASYDDRDKWHRDTNVNVNGAINVAIAARETGARVVYFQTALIYGNNPYTTNRFLEWPDGRREQVNLPQTPLPETQPINPESSYAISKYAAERYLLFNSGSPLTVFRLANIYGPRNLSGPIPTFFKRLSSGEQCTIVDSRRDFVYIDDLVNLVMQAIDGNIYGTYHASTGRDYPIGQLYDAVVSAMDAYGTDNPIFQDRGLDDAPTILLDPSRTKAMFGWEATTDIDEGVEQAVAWYRDNPPAQTFTHLAMKG